MKYLLTTVAVLIPNAAPAQIASTQAAPERTLQVTGTATVRTEPDIALLDIYLRGEGPTPDAATTAIAAKQKAVANGLAGLLGPNTELTGSNVTIIKARSGTCADARGYGSSHA